MPSKVVCLLVMTLCQLYSGVFGSQCELAATCVTDLTQEDCEEMHPGSVLVPGYSISGCCPGCQIGGEQPVGCRPPSVCLPDGKFAPVQCKGDHFSGRCFCTDENGRRIFGQMWQSQASEMTCACSRRRAELEGDRPGEVTLHCTPTGDYEPLQCDNGLCWCAEPKTGTPTVTPVHQDDMSILPCYVQAEVGEQYLRRCESIVHALAVLHREQSDHGTDFLGNPTTFCDYDGSYGPYQIVNGEAYCTGRTSQILGSWQVQVAEMAGMNCNCALDRVVHFPAVGMTVSEVCLANGNYRPLQHIGGRYYCVDTDGYPTTDLLEDLPDHMCSIYA